jgi:hypothetical protein
VKGVVKFSALRNWACHRGVVEMVKQKRFGLLARNILNDKENLEAFGNRTTELMLQARKCMEIVEAEWFKSVGRKGERGVTFRLTEKGKARLGEGTGEGEVE